MNQFAYNIASSPEFGRQVTLVVDGETSTITDSHHSFEEIIDALLDGDYQEAVRLANAGQEIRAKFLSLSDRVSVRGNTVYYDNEPLYSRLASTIMDFWRNGRDFTRLTNFLENLMLNPSEHSRAQLYEFLDRHNFVITEDGHFIAYKGVSRDGTSIHSGYGIVDGQEYTHAHLPNNEGSLVEIPRSMVDDNPAAACSTGLHVGSWRYASAFGQGMTLKVEVNPRDVVSVPRDSDFQKVRVTRYLVLEQTEQEIDENEYYVSSTLDNDWGYEEDYDDVSEYLIDELRTEASSYSRKGKVGTSYRAILEDILGPLSELENEVVDDLDADHQARAVYRYHIDRL